MGTLYLVGTPIGNLEDVSERALHTLRQVRLIAAEIPPRTQRLLARYDIHTPMVRFTDAYDRKKRPRLEMVLAALAEGDVALVSEAGMPGLADPGYELLAAVLERGFPVEPVPGPTALSAALAVAGIPAERFIFLGFLPSTAGARGELPSSPTKRRTACWQPWPTWRACSASGKWPWLVNSPNGTRRCSAAPPPSCWPTTAPTRPGASLPW